MLARWPRERRAKWGDPMRRYNAVLLIALLTAGAGCSTTTTPDGVPVTTGQTPETTSATATTSPPATTQPSVMTVREAAAMYVRIVAPANRASATLNRIMQQGSPDLAAAKRAAAVDADANRAFSLALQSGKWPVAIQPAVDALVEALASDIVEVRTMAAATTQDALLTAWYNVASSSTAAAGKAELVRQKLGLPVAPN